MKHRKLTEAKAAKMIFWFQGLMGLQDWTFEMYVSNDPPDKMGKVDEDVLGLCLPDVKYKNARIWVSPARCDTMAGDQEETLFHELCHVVAVDVRIRNDTSEPVEYLWNRLGIVFKMAWNNK